VKTGQPIRYQVPRLVERYIREHYLYLPEGRKVAEDPNFLFD
jgi:hypothetical protein